MFSWRKSKHLKGRWGNYRGKIIFVDWKVVGEPAWHTFLDQDSNPQENDFGSWKKSEKKLRKKIENKFEEKNVEKKTNDFERKKI